MFLLVDERQCATYIQIHIRAYAIETIIFSTKKAIYLKFAFDFLSLREL